MNESLLSSARILRCPLCHCGGSFHSGSFICEHRHCFDLASAGYLNLVPQQRPGKYGKSSFQSRAFVFSAGAYLPLVKRLAEILSFTPFSPDFCLVDAGCGEGYYAARLQSALRVPVVGLDIERDALKLAAKRSQTVAWLVADLSNLPLKDQSASAVLNLLSPANYGEFARILRPDGLLAKVIPGESYLIELRELLGGRLRGESAAGVEAEMLFRQNTSDCRVEELDYRVAVSETLAAHFFAMTPLSFGRELSPGALRSLDSIRIHLKILTGRQP
ncbi:MAG: methyltransferase domain-containing protein [Christensenellaceae bacterium]|jgi:23S rRNA (guanine745-N1)-methyltransferase|nr:methyltransferase domain-containing protein [Christensenellaceae bacterium]